MGIYNEYMNKYIKPIRIALDDVGFKEKKALETCRLDLDAAKAKLKKVKTLEMRDQVENEVQAAQVNSSSQLQKKLIYCTTPDYTCT